MIQELSSLQVVALIIALAPQLELNPFHDVLTHFGFGQCNITNLLLSERPFHWKISTLTALLIFLNPSNWISNLILGSSLSDADRFLTGTFNV